MRWIKRSGHYKDRGPVIGCFDWDPFAALLGDEIEMVRQDVQGMLKAVFEVIDHGSAKKVLIEIPPIFMGSGEAKPSSLSSRQD
jgi:LacI family fructose operon transcriptional repressor